MKKILEDMYTEYRKINIDDSVTIFDYLKEYNFFFKVIHVNSKEFKQMCNIDGTLETISCYKNYIAGYKNNHDNDDFRLSGGLKLSDPKEIIRGSFVVQDKRIIYDVGIPFFNEKDAYLYGGKIFYTDMSMKELLMEELRRKKDCLIYLGDKIQGNDHIPQFEEVSKDEMLEYVTNPEKGNLVYTKRMHY